jgi:hypothetical protein
MHDEANDIQLLKALTAAKPTNVDAANWACRRKRSLISFDDSRSGNRSVDAPRTSTPVHPAAVVALGLALAVFAGSAAVAWWPWF